MTRTMFQAVQGWPQRVQLGLDVSMIFLLGTAADVAVAYMTRRIWIPLTEENGYLGFKRKLSDHNYS